MGRLIDADKLLETLQGLKPHCWNKDYEYGMLNTIRYCMPEIINDEPTADDVDKIVEKLEEIRVKKTCNKEKCDAKELFRICIVDDAIEIVKQGGVSDNVCEWKSVSNGEFIQNPHTKRLYSNEPSMKNVYCNTCGKKIKVVDK